MFYVGEVAAVLMRLQGNIAIEVREQLSKHSEPHYKGFSHLTIKDCQHLLIILSPSTFLPLPWLTIQHSKQRPPRSNKQELKLPDHVCK
jgi:hypothetical protein